MTTPGTTTTPWTIPGADGEPIFGDCHQPAGDPGGVVVIAHGFKGYKDYGMFPRIAATFAGAGFVAHRFNFSHSGMTNALDTFERPDLFERDTWNKQVFDLYAVIGAVSSGAIAGRGLPYVLFGHSRGGVTVLLAAGRRAGDGAFQPPAAIITAAAPCRCNSLTSEQEEELLRSGALASPSSRTGQTLKVGRAFLDEQRADPDGHDLCAVASRITCPVLLIHGETDPTVPVDDAGELGRAIGDRATVRIVAGADHVFNTTNPLAESAAASPQLRELLEAATAFAGGSVGRV